MSADRSLRLFYVPVPDRDCGTRLVRECVQRKLAACGNLLGPMVSFYEWEGRMREESEYLLVLKTAPDLAEALQDYLQHAHPYDCPCICQIPAEANPAFAEWVRMQR